MKKIILLAFTLILTSTALTSAEPSGLSTENYNKYLKEFLKNYNEILLKGEKNCAPIDNSLEENWFYHRDIETIRQLLKKIDKGVSIKGFMRNR